MDAPVTPRESAPVTSRESAPGDMCERLRAIVGETHVIEAAADASPFLQEPRGLFNGRARCIVRPRTREEVSAVVRLCQACGVPIVPQGGNTGLVGGQTPLVADAVVLSLVRMTAVRDIDPVTNTMTVEAGLTLEAVQATAHKAGRFYPLWLASAGSCTIGGTLATNAGGVNVIAFGTTRDLVNGVEVVLADGRILSDLSRLKKDNTGYDLKHLFIGSEGTLGIITAAVLKLQPLPRTVATAFAGVASPAAALKLLGRAHDTFGSTVRAFELMPRVALDFVLGVLPGSRDPLGAPHPWYVLVELASPADEALADALAMFLAEASEDDVVSDATVAASDSQAQALWALREGVSDAQKHYGGSIKHDISVPIADVPAFLAAVEPAVQAAVPGARLCAFGHLGDGNIHCNVQQPEGADKAAFLQRWAEMNEVVHAIVGRFGGSISAEHGIGRLKRDLLPVVKDAVALDTMRAIKAALDPSGILNPGALL